MTQICLIEDDEILSESLCERFRIEGLTFDHYCTGKPAGMALQSRQFDVVLCDLRLPDLSGRAIFEALDSVRRPPFVFMTGFGTIDEAVDLLKAGAEDFLTKPFDLDSLVQRLHRLVHLDRPGRGQPILGISPPMRKIETLLERLAQSTEPVLITGESGVGKEEACRLLHKLNGERRSGNRVPVNCAAIPESLMEAELFGYVRGAFTGAFKAHRGLVEQANGGTLFLDEIGDMSLGMQTRLLRVLQDHCVTRIGAEASTPVDFRLVCATHRDLPSMVRAGQFREDLYYRVNVIAIHIPPLRDRREDILWLADKMLADLSRSARGARKGLTLAAQQALYAHSWPGNVRELNHVLRRALALGLGARLEPGDLFSPEQGSRESLEPAEPGRSLNEHLDNAEKAFLVKALQDHKGAITEAANTLGISRKTLWDKMRRHHIDRTRFTEGRELAESRR